MGQLHPPIEPREEQAAAGRHTVPTTRSSDVQPRAHRQSHLTAQERQEQKRERQQQQRESTQQRAAAHAQAAAMLATPDLSIFDVLMIEFALQPENRAEPGAMRADFLMQLHVDEKDRARATGARTRAHIPKQAGVASLDTLQHVLLSSLELREAAALVVTMRKRLYAEMLSGMPPFRVVAARPDESLMMLMTRTRRELQPRLGRPAAGPSTLALSVRQSRSGGQVTLDWREREHFLRVFAANQPISYRALRAVAAAGAMLHMEGLEESSLSRSTSRSAATMHDEQNHLIQRMCAREAAGKSPLIFQWDEVSKCKKAQVVGTLVCSREEGDVSRQREVLGAKALLKDLEDGGKKKSGKNVAKGCVDMLLGFVYPDGCPAKPAPDGFYTRLHYLAFLISDFTTSNSGKHSGAAAIIRQSIFKLSGHLLGEA
jgi:hypothetical protein